jgi:long-chain acyl-CoA synthetase
VSDNFNDFESIPNLVSMFLSRAALRGDRPFLGYKDGSEWCTISWAEAARRVAGLAKT